MKAKRTRREERLSDKNPKIHSMKGESKVHWDYSEEYSEQKLSLATSSGSSRILKSESQAIARLIKARPIATRLNEGCVHPTVSRNCKID